MNILLLGSGGREHAIAHKVKQSPLCTSLFVAPGNAGTMQFGTNVQISINDFEEITSFCLQQSIEMIIVGPEDPLVNGIYDFFAQQEKTKHIKIIGPSKFGAQLEGSKAFSKQFMQRHNIPTAGYAQFTIENFNEGLNYLQNHTVPIVLKADGLAAGKGVVICATIEEAIIEFTAMIQDKKFGTASTKVVVEQFLDGIEMSIFALTDGEKYILLPAAKDYKRIGEGDTGLNTGGMGAISPVPFASAKFMQKVVASIIEPTIKGLHKENITYKGFVFFGLIKVGENPYVIEYNCRLGDPETEAVLPRLENDLVELFIQTHNGNLGSTIVKHKPEHSCTIVCVSGGYPGNFEKNKPITNLENTTNSFVYHAGTKMQANEIVSNGGRVLAITSLAPTLQEAVAYSLKKATAISYQDKNFRKDIGYEFL